MFTELIIISSALVVLGILAAIYYSKHRTEKEVGTLLLRVMPIWASFGPFANASESSSMLYYCFWAVDGKDSAVAAVKAGVIENHRISFNEDPEEWEKLRIESLEKKQDDFEPKRRLAGALYEYDQAEKNGDPFDWSKCQALGYILTSPDNQSAQTFYSHLQHLMENIKEVEQQTTDIMEEYVFYTNTEIDLNMSAGLLCYICMRAARNNPELEESIEIIKLSDEMFEESNAKEKSSSQ